MDKTPKTTNTACHATPQAASEKEGRRMIARDFSRLMAIPPSRGARWTGTTADLMEAAHIAYTEGGLRRADGSPLPFAQVARQACRSLNRPAPHNPSGRAAKAAARKGVKQDTLLGRYTWLAANGRRRSLIGEMVETPN